MFSLPTFLLSLNVIVCITTAYLAPTRAPTLKTTETPTPGIQTTRKTPNPVVATTTTTTMEPFIHHTASKHPTPTTTLPPPPTTTKSFENLTVCYPYVGCFDNFPPFDNANLDLPLSPEQVGTRMWLYTRDNKGVDRIHYKDLGTITNSHFNPSKKTKFIIHGFSNTFNSTWIHEMKDELLKKDDFNVVIVSWGPGAAFPNYNQAVANTRMVGTQIRLIIDLMVRAGAVLDDMHLIGHSLGAHTSGYAGYLLHGQLGRISGLDAAEPDFENHPIEIRLDSADAKFVDVIHTNGAPITSGGAGLMQVSGHVDFYVNGGKTQPGCPSQIGGLLSNLVHFQFGSVGDTVSCSHSRSHIYFTESINSACPFTAYPCDTYDNFEDGLCFQCTGRGCSQLGYYADQYQARGKLFLDTSSNAPFCGFEYAVNVRSGAVETQGTVSIRLHGNWGSTDWQTVTEDDADLKSGAVYKKIVVSPVEVGDIESVDIKYQKAAGGWFFGGGGLNSWAAHEVSVVSGEFGDRPAGHIITGDLNITNNDRFRSLLSNGSKYREAQTFSLRQDFKLLMDSIEDYARRYAQREDVELPILYDRDAVSR